MSDISRCLSNVFNYSVFSIGRFPKCFLSPRLGKPWVLLVAMFLSNETATAAASEFHMMLTVIALRCGHCKTSCSLQVLTMMKAQNKWLKTFRNLETNYTYINSKIQVFARNFYPVHVHVDTYAVWIRHKIKLIRMWLTLPCITENKKQPIGRVFVLSCSGSSHTAATSRVFLHRVQGDEQASHRRRRRGTPSRNVMGDIPWVTSHSYMIWMSLYPSFTVTMLAQSRGRQSWRRSKMLGPSRHEYRTTSWWRVRCLNNNEVKYTTSYTKYRHSGWFRWYDT